MRPSLWQSVSGCVAWLDMLEAGTYTVTAGAPNTVTSIRNQATGVAWNTAAIADFPEYESGGINGNPCMLGASGSVRGLISGDPAVLAAFTGNDPAHTIAMVTKPVTADQRQGVFGAGRAADANENYFYVGTGSSSQNGQWMYEKGDPELGAVKVHGEVSIVAEPQVVVWVFGAGATVKIYVNLTLVVSGVLDAGPMTPDQVGLFARPDNTPDFQYDGRIGCLGVWNRDIGDERITLTSRLMSRWGIQ